MEPNYADLISAWRNGESSGLIAYINQTLRGTSLCVNASQIWSGNEELLCPIVLLPVSYSEVCGGDSIFYIELVCLLPDGNKGCSITVSNKEIKSPDWFNNKLSVRTGNYLTNAVYSVLLRVIFSLAKLLSVNTVFDRLGYISEHQCYVTGGQVFSFTNNNCSISRELKKYAWNYRSDLSEKVCCKYVIENYMSVLPFGKILFLISYEILSTWVSRLKQHGLYVIQFVVIMLGLTGIGKSTIAKLLFDLSPYSRIHCNFESSIAAIMSILQTMSDTITIIDDIYPSDSTARSKEIDRKAETILRCVCENGGNRRKMNGSYLYDQDCYSLPLFTAERLPFQSESSIARIVCISLNKSDVNWEAVTHCQGNSYYWSTTLGNYVRQTLKSDECLFEIENHFAKSRCELIQNGIKVHPRVSEAMAWIEAGFASFLSYAKDIGAISDEDFVDFMQRARNATLDYLRSVEQIRKNPDDQITDALQNLVFFGDVKIVEAKRHKNNSIRADVNSKAVIGFFDENSVYLFKEKSINAMNYYFGKNNIGYYVTEKALLDCFDHLDLFYKTTRVDGTRTSQKVINNQRISVVCLKKADFDKKFGRKD